MSAAGGRVRLIRHTDPHATLKPGTLGTVLSIDGTGTVHVRWDNGSTLGMIAEAGDRFEPVPDGPCYTPHPCAVLADALAEAVAVAQAQGLSADDIRSVFDGVLAVLPGGAS
jgi:Domain of unknown function (DUF4314)